MSEPSIIVLAGFVGGVLVIGIWATTIVFVYWDTRQRNLVGQQKLVWSILSLVPFVGLGIYLLNRRQTRLSSRENAPPRKRMTQLQPQQGATGRWLPTIAAAEYVHKMEQEAVNLAESVPAYQCVLSVTAGPHLGQQFVISQFPAHMGRLVHNIVRLDRDLGVSRQHAEIYQQSGALRLRDLGSTHGTHINDTVITEQEIASGDEIRVGYSTMVVEAINLP